MNTITSHVFSSRSKNFFVTDPNGSITFTFLSSGISTLIVANVSLSAFITENSEPVYVWRFGSTENF